MLNFLKGEAKNLSETYGMETVLRILAERQPDVELSDWIEVKNYVSTLYRRW